MFPEDAVCAASALFIVAMVWLRTRMHYARTSQRRLRLSAVGVLYFTALAALVVSGWFVVPRVALRVAALAPLSPVLTRSAWFLLLYYLFIPVHRVLVARGSPVFEARVTDPAGPA